MNEVLEPLLRVPGVRLVALVSQDGVPIAAPGASRANGGSDCAEAWRDASVLSALAASWMDELARSVGMISWEFPQRAVLRAARGTLLMMPTAGAVLVVVLERGTGADTLWLPMEGVAARIQRRLRALGGGAAEMEHEEVSDVRSVGAEPVDASSEASAFDPRAALPGETAGTGDPGVLARRRVAPEGPEGTAGS